VLSVLAACGLTTGVALSAESPSTQVNATVGLGLNQGQPAIAATPSGGLVAVWLDERNGTADIRWRLFGADGGPLAASEQVNEDPIRRVSEESPRVAVDGAGNFTVTWSDSRNGDADVFVRQFDASGTPLGASLVVNDDAGEEVQGYPDIACDALGNFVVVWEDSRGDAAIYAQRFGSSGAPLGSNFRVDVPAEFAFTSRPAVGMSPNGAFTIAWIDVDLYFPEIFARAYASDGTPWGDPLWVSDDATDMDHQRPDVAMSDDDHALVTWADQRDAGTYGVFAQRVGTAGALIGSNFRVDEAQGGIYNMDPVVALGPSNAFVISWHDYVDGLRSIFGQWFASDGQPLGRNVLVAEPSSPTSFYSPAIAVDGYEQTTIVWESIRYQAPQQYDLGMQRFDSARNPLGPATVANDDVAACNQEFPEIAANGSGAFAVVWEDMRDGHEDVYIRRYASDGTPLGAETLVNDDATDVHQRQPNVAMNDAGQSVVAWIDGRVSYSDVFFQLYDAYGLPVGPNTKVNEGTEGSQYGIELAMAPSGEFVVVWADSRFDFYDVFMQRYDATGAPLGGNVRVNTDPAGTTQSSPDVAIDGAGNFTVVWSENDGHMIGWNLYAQSFDSSGVRLGDIFKVNDGSGGVAYRRYSVLDMHPGGSTVYAWRDNRSGEYEIYARRFDSSGAPLGPDFKVSDDSGPALRTSPEVAVDVDASFTVLWTDYRSDYPQVYYQRFGASGKPAHGNRSVGNDLPPALQSSPSAAYGRGCLYVTWQGNHLPDQGYDIWLATDPGALGSGGWRSTGGPPKWGGTRNP